jgi:hypothetical protein
MDVPRAEHATLRRFFEHRCKGLKESSKNHEEIINEENNKLHKHDRPPSGTFGATRPGTVT